ncbi:two-component sensor histidine kinase [Microbispora hainanensis]|uniref:histidine kinase n=1 Tax=Microbispora hainanensis TaxID=568844 RepID=A0A544Y706_9ACTN|nr:two-component sensor histidine kinase [Microbispora hainanensis]
MPISAPSRGGVLAVSSLRCTSGGGRIRSLGLTRDVPRDQDNKTVSERRGWWQFTLDVLRPVRKTTPLSRRSLLADLLLAIALTIAAVAATAGATDGDHRVDGQPHSLSEPLRLRPSPPPRGGDVPPDRWGRPVIAPDDGQEDSGPLPLLVVLTALPLAVRRLYPLITFWAVLAAALATRDDATWITVLTFAIAGYGAVAHSPHRAPAMGGLVLAAVLAGAAFQDSVPALPSWLGPFVVLMSAGVAAGFVRSWRRRLDAGRRRLTELQRAQEEAMRKAVKEERSRIAGELHDVVTHNVNVMVIQAGAARAVMDTAPARSKQAMLAVEAGGRAAMAELRHVMGLLAGPESERADGSADGLEPQPGLDQLDSLIERVRAAGVPVSVEISPPPRPLPPGVELTVYRVIQEALTNTIKHAAGAAASVTIDYHGDWLEIEITDTGGRRTTGAGDGRGRGLIGMRERLALYGGTLQAGARGDGGYQIKARILWATT